MRILNHNKKIAFISTVFISSILATLIVATPAQADVVGEEECFPAVLMLKGSGEGTGTNGSPVGVKIYKPAGTDTPYIKTNGHEGAVLGGLLEAFVNKTDPSKTVSKVRFIGVKYPALPVYPNTLKTDNAALNAAVNSVILTKHVVDYNESYRIGAQMTLDVIKKDEQRGCNTQYLLLSYSQGVISARLAMNLLDNSTDKVISSYALGDPFQKADAAKEPRQRTLANTSPYTNGVGRTAAKSIEINAGTMLLNPSLAPLSIAAGTSIVKYTQEITRADPFMYRDEGNDGAISRTLCHFGDPTCGFGPANVDPEKHTNYFDPAYAEGTTDITNEVSEFDKQVQFLANSVPTNPRERSLVSTPAVLGQNITYNVANARSDDKCYWDLDSNGSIDKAAPCDLYTVNATASTKMTVKVVDSFNTEHTFSMNDNSIDPTEIEKSLNLKPDTWYQYKPYQSTQEWKDSHFVDEEECLEYWQPDSAPINDSGSVDYDLCGVMSNPPTSQNAGQAFKNVPHLTSKGTEYNVVWGYDDDYSLGEKDEKQVGVKYTPNASGENLKISLSAIMDGKPYYSIGNNAKCISSTSDWNVIFEKCDSSNIHQLFSAVPLKGQYGNLSIEKDKTAPTKVEDTHVTMAKSSTKLQWSPSTDGRTDYVDYRIYQKNSSTGAYALVKTTSSAVTEFSISNLQKNVSYTYKIVAFDYAGNEAEPSTITFKLPSVVPSKPASPTLVSKSYSGKSITMAFKNGGDSNARALVWKDSKLLAVTPATTYTDTQAEQGAYSTYTYQLEVSPNVYTAESSDLTVLLEE